MHIWKGSSDVQRCPYMVRGVPLVYLLFDYQGIARTQSPTTRNYTPEFPTFGGIVRVSTIRSAMERPRRRRTSFMIKVSPAPGKYA